MNVRKFSISNDPSIYEIWPDVARASDGRLVCLFNECTSHGDYTYCRVVITTSFDRGRTWTPKKQFYTGPTSAPEDPYYYPVPRITHLRDGRLCVALTRAPSTLREEDDCKARIILCFFFRQRGNVGQP